MIELKCKECKTVVGVIHESYGQQLKLDEFKCIKCKPKQVVTQ